MTNNSNSDGILRQLAGLEKLDAAQLKERWRALYGAEPPTHNRQFLVRRLSYRIQELAHGGLSQQAKDRMEQILEEAGCDELGRLPGHNGNKRNPAPVPGTRLIREWQGSRHEVTALSKGFEYEGRPYKSLSAIAREITGTRWNGPAFFGLRSQAGQNNKTIRYGAE